MFCFYNAPSSFKFIQKLFEEGTIVIPVIPELLSFPKKICTSLINDSAKRVPNLSKPLFSQYKNEYNSDFLKRLLWEMR
jgi:hypothetical protein